MKLVINILNWFFKTELKKSGIVMHGSITNKIFSLHDCHFHNLAHVQYLVYVRQWVSKNDQAGTCMHVHVHV